MTRRLGTVLLLGVFLLGFSFAQSLAESNTQKNSSRDSKILPESLLAVTYTSPQKPSQTPWQKVCLRAEQFWKKWNPGVLMNRMDELLAVSDMLKIHKAAMLYTERKRTSPKALGALVEEGFLPESFLGGVKGKYQFSLNVTEVFFGVQADPLDPRRGLTSFYVGLDGIVRGEVGKPANEKSPPAGEAGLPV